MITTNLSVIADNYYNMTGTTYSAHKADIIFITKYSSFSEYLPNLINEIWNEHLVLVSQIPCGKKLSIPGLLPDVKVQGWDMPDLQLQMQELAYLQSKIKLWGKGLERDIKEEKWENFHRQNRLFGSFLELIPSKSQEKIFKLLIEGHTLSFKETMYKLKNDIVTTYIKKQEEIFMIRQSWLLCSIDKGLKIHKQMIVILDPVFVSGDLSRANNSPIEKIKPYLHNKPFVILEAPIFRLEPASECPLDTIKEGVAMSLNKF